MTGKLSLKGIALTVCITVGVLMFAGDWAKPLHSVAEVFVSRLENIIKVFAPTAAPDNQTAKDDAVIPDHQVLGIEVIENYPEGLRITEIASDAPGDYAGFEVGDTILRINDVKIVDKQVFSDAIEKSGENARFQVLCGKTGRTLDVEVTLDKT